jgi:uncharacterized protein
MKHPEHISLDAVVEEPLAFTFELPFALEVLDREPLLKVSPVRLAGTVSRIEGGFTLEARCVFRGELECSRCLAPFPFAVDEDFALLLYPRAAGPKAAAAPEETLGKDEADVCEYEGGQLLVAPIAEERVQLAIPMKPLCREECLGLCPHCGKDRNLVPCACAEELVDSRWAALEAFKSATKSQKV